MLHEYHPENCNSVVITNNYVNTIKITSISWRDRVYEEWVMFWQYWQITLVGLLYNLYVIFMTSRNLAFYRHEIGKPLLKDIGFDLIPRSEAPFVALLSEFPVKFALFSVLFMCAFSLFDNTRTARKPHAVSILFRMGMVALLGQTLRILSFLSTSLPGTSDFCLSEAARAIQPKTLTEVFFGRFAISLNSNCGDLMFSGHMLHLIVFALTFHRYADICFSPRVSQWWISCMKLVLWVMVPIQALCIIAQRHHYTADVVVATYLTPLLWYFYCNKLHKVDWVPAQFINSASPSTSPTHPADEEEEPERQHQHQLPQTNPTQLIDVIVQHERKLNDIDA